MAKKNKNDGSDQTVEQYEFEPIKGYPMLNWKGKRPFTSTQYYPAQLKESFGKHSPSGWMNRVYWGDNLQAMSHLLKEFRGKVDLVYIDPPFDSKEDYRIKISAKGKSTESDNTFFEEKQYSDIWANDDFLQFIYERIVLIRELLSDDGAIYLHCDYRKAHQIRCILDEVFGPDKFLNSLVWNFSTRSSIKSSWKRSHHDILFYKKSRDPVFNWDDEMVLEPLSEATIKKYRLQDEIGRYRLNGRFIKDSPIKGAKDVDAKWEKSHPHLVVRDYLREGKVAGDVLHIEIENQSSASRTDYPTQKPQELLLKLISASTKPDGLVLDAFAGSGTTLVAAHMLGRRYIGIDINKGSIETTIGRLCSLAPGQGFEVYWVNNYDLFRNPVEARDLIIAALEISPLTSSIFHGEKDGRLVYIMPTNRIATRADLAPLISGLDYKTLEKRSITAPNKPVERLLIICMGHEADLKAHLAKEVPFNLDIEVVDVLSDRTDLHFKRESEARIKTKGRKLIIDRFYPMNLLQKLSLQKEKVTDWRELVESVLIDWHYDGAVLEPSVIDIPAKDELVKGEYEIPADAGTIRVKITDLLSESLEVEVERE
jgi:DNA modification methylase